MAVRRPLLVVLLALAAAASAFAQGLPRGRPDPLGFAPDRLARIDSVMQRYVDSGRVAGVVTLVARHGRVAQLGAYGWSDREAGRRMSADAIFRIASQSKAVTSVAVMMLVEAGRLGLADPVSRWLPGFATAAVATPDTAHPRVPLRRPISIRDLLTHTAGISYGTDSLVAPLYRAAGLGPAAGYGWYFADKTEPICASMDRLAALPFVAQPGERFVYGYNTDILGCLVERVSRMPLDEFLRTRIFAPLKMRDTHFFLPTAERERLAAVYAVTDRGIVRAPDGPLGQGSYVDGPRASFSGGAGLLSTAGDYARFLQMLLNGGTLDGARILAPATVALMTRNQAGTVYDRTGASGFGLGFEVLLDPGLAGQYGSVGRYGWGGAYATNYWVDPGQDLVAVLMLQLLPSGGLDIGDRFRNLVYQAIVGPPAAR